ncbi:prepilin-type N-terminal cleavage/methylation domain-containing protein [Gammaproteobacteria bacterium]|nr:prepilin-type N-terminal cleavage/methylation domain-containing protein [Gammaproteobacteria bacterium]
MQAKQQGFTLLEVLLAGFILFLTISVTTLIYKGALLSSGKAERSLAISAAAPAIRRLVTEQVRNIGVANNSLGDGRYGDIEYRWEAALISIGKPSLALVELNDLEDTQVYSLWNVELSLQKGPLVKNYNFTEISW